MKFAVAAASAVLGIVPLTPGAVHADAPGPTDFQTEIVSVSPPAQGVEFSVIGGDSFLAVDVQRGVSIAVTGYRGEPYLEVTASGEVRENHASVTYATSKSRYGAALPDGVNAATPPQWHTVATDGRFAWHDHRIHWMNSFDPPGRQRGDVVLEAVVPITVDGVATAVTVASTWKPSPSAVPLWTGLILGVAAGATGVVLRRRFGVLVAMLGVAAGLALIIGGWQFRSLPSTTGPSPTLWLFPAVAVVVAAAAWAARQRRQRLLALAAVAIGGGELAIWTVRRWDGLTAAVLPTNAPFWLDRGVSAAVLTTSALVTAAAVIELLSPTRSSE